MLFRLGIHRYCCVIEEQVQDNYYELVLNFDNNTFDHIYKRSVYEGGDGHYETIYHGVFAKETSGGGGRKKSLRDTAKNRRGSHSSPQLSSSSSQNITSPRTSGVGSVVYYMCKVETRDYLTRWEPWDQRLGAEKVVRKGDVLHQDLLFRVAPDGTIVNENIAPPCVMAKKN